MNKKIIYRLLYIIIALIIVSCAQQVSPTGGPVDKAPPKLKNSVPANGAVNFAGNRIELQFDEFIQLKDAQNQLIISPPFKEKPDLILKNKVLLIKLPDEPLKENTTYTFNFGNAIADITENNAEDNFQFVFSTGTEIDTLRLTGNVKNAKDLNPEKGVYVLLYPENADDSAVYKLAPSYFGKTNSSGQFEIGHIKSGKYKVVALKDGNQNLKYDMPDELVGFSDNTIEISSDKTIDLKVFEENNKKQYIKKTNDGAYGATEIYFNKPLKNPEIKAIEKENWLYIEKSANLDTLSFWYKNDKKDSLKIIIKDVNGYVDTVISPYKTIESMQTRGGKGGVFKLGLSNNINSGQPFTPGDKLILKANHPLASIDTSKIEITNNKLRLYNNWVLPSFGTKIAYSNNQFNDAEKYSVKLFPGAFRDIFGLSNDTMKFEFTVGEKENYGNFKLTVTSAKMKGDLILYLLDDKDKELSKKIIKETDFINGKAPVQYLNLTPKEYKLKLIRDENANGSWDTGNYLKRLQPEQIIYFGGKLTVRENWDLEQEWILDEK